MYLAEKLIVLPKRTIYICAYAYAYMVKVISLSDEAYRKLKALKKDGSFSEIVIELIDHTAKRNIMDFAGAFKDNSDEWKKINETIYKDRKKFSLRTYAL